MKGNFKLVLGLIFVLAFQLTLALKVSNAQICPAPNPDSRFITGPEFLNNNSWTTEGKILNFLKSSRINSWLQGPKGDGIIEDVDVNRTPINFPEEILKAARDPLGLPGVSPRPINPQLLVAKVQAENGLLLRRKRPSDRDLAKIMNCGSPTTIARQIRCAAETLRAGLNGFDNLAACRIDTPYGVDRITQTKDGVNVKPKNAATGAIFGYTDEAGIQWGGVSDPPIGGTANFCGVWNGRRYVDMGVFASPPTTLTLRPDNPTLTCGDPLGPPDRRNVVLSVSGGTPPYTWTVTWPPGSPGSNTPGTLGACPLSGGEDAVLKPPANKDGAGTAYTTAKCALLTCEVLPGIPGTQLEVTGPMFGCNDNFIGFDSACGCGPTTCAVPGPTTATCANSLGTCIITCGAGTLINPASMPVTGDNRTQDMIKASCNPCVGVMSGAIVKVKDSTKPTAVEVIIPITVR